jgi:hypothetical protein
MDYICNHVQDKGEKSWYNVFIIFMYFPLYAIELNHEYDHFYALIDSLKWIVGHLIPLDSLGTVLGFHLLPGTSTVPVSIRSIISSTLDTTLALENMCEISCRLSPVSITANGHTCTHTLPSWLLYRLQAARCTHPWQDTNWNIDHVAPTTSSAISGRDLAWQWARSCKWECRTGTDLWSEESQGQEARSTTLD